MNDSKRQDIVNEIEAAEFLNMNVKTLQNWRWKGLPPRFLKLGRSVRYKISDLQDYMDSCVVETIENVKDKKVQVTICPDKKEAPCVNRGQGANGKNLLEQEGEETISTAHEDVKISGNALSADERRFLARAEISFQKQRIAMLRAECHEAVRRIRKARRILLEA